MKVVLLPWGAKVSPEFAERVIAIADRLGTNPDWLMACIAFETAESFSPSIRNPMSGATGLIQFMPVTARGLGTTCDGLAKMTAEGQLEYVERYFRPLAGKLNTLEDVYMAILWPAAVGKPANFVLFVKGTTTYKQNAGLDPIQADGTKKGYVTKADAAASPRAKLQKGLTYFAG